MKSACREAAILLTIEYDETENTCSTVSAVFFSL